MYYFYVDCFRFTMRIRSLRTVRANYKAIMMFLNELGSDFSVNATVSAKASGFLQKMETFDFSFFLTMLIEIFHKIENLNRELQNSQLSVVDAFEKVDAIQYVLKLSRESKFDTIWDKTKASVKELDIEDAKLPRVRNVPKHLNPDSKCSAHIFKSPTEMYKKIYFEVYDQVISSLNLRFGTESAIFFKSLENFIISKDLNVEEIVEFYKDDFDKNSLVADRDMFLDVTIKKNVKVQNLKDVVNFLREHEWCKGLVPEYVRFVKLLLTIPASSCTNERSFSTLKRLKNYLRSTMGQKRVNYIAILHIYHDVADKIDDERLIDEFIQKNAKRTNVFAMSTDK